MTALWNVLVAIVMVFACTAVICGGLVLATGTYILLHDWIVGPAMPPGKRT